MRRSVGLLMLMVLLLTAGVGRAEELERAVGELDVSSWQEAVDEAEGRLDVAGLLRGVALGETELSPESVMERLRAMIWGEAGDLRALLTALVAPALLWALNRRLTADGRLGEAAELVCYLAGAGVMLSAFAAQTELARRTIRQLGELTGRVFPVLTALLTASGRPGAAGMTQAMVAFAGGAMTTALERTTEIVCPAAALLAVAGNLSGRMRLDGLFRICCSAGNWLVGGLMSAFLAMTTLSGVMAGARDGLTVRAARYAADNLLPVVGGEVADTMDAMAQSAGLVRSAAGVTGLMVMLVVCLRPLIRLALGMMTYRLAAALTEPAADGPLKRCAEQLAQAVRLMLAAVAASGAMFVTLAGVCLSAR